MNVFIRTGFHCDINTSAGIRITGVRTPKAQVYKHKHAIINNSFTEVEVNSDGYLPSLSPTLR